jgi:uncharacterized protein (DUF2252 family)
MASIVKSRKKAATPNRARRAADAVAVNTTIVERGNLEQRFHRGRAHRENLSRAALGDLETSKRKLDVIGILQEFQKNRVPELLPVKYKRMSVSPFAFFRGSVGLMAADLARLPHTGIMVQLCGDAHVQNLGSFAGPDGRLLFDLNDFDETIAGPWEWDAKRMATSIVLAGWDSGHRKAGCTEAVAAFGAAYQAAIAELAGMPLLAAARHHANRDKSKPVSGAIAQSRRAQPFDLLQKYTTTDAAGSVVFHDTRPDLRRATSKEKAAVLAALPAYRQSLAPERRHIFDFFQPVDVAFKIVGTGSVGSRDWVVLMFGNGPSDALFLQIKQEVESAYAEALGRTGHDHQGQRVVDGQRRIQALSDLLLGWTTIGKYQYLVRQLNDRKGSIDIKKLKGEGLHDLATVAGELLAHGHARSGDAIELLGYIGNGERVTQSLIEFALGYADLVRRDFEVFQKAIARKKIVVAEDADAAPPVFSKG